MMFINLLPIFGMLLGSLALHEPVPVVQVLASALIISGIVVAYTSMPAIGPAGGSSGGFAGRAPRLAARRHPPVREVFAIGKRVPYTWVATSKHIPPPTTPSHGPRDQYEHRTVC